MIVGGVARPHEQPQTAAWLPRFYLRGFCAPSTSADDAAQVWLFRRADGDPVLTSVAKVAVQSHLYSPRAKAGARSYALEQRLAQLESHVATIWPAVSEREVPLANESVRKTLALFVATLHVRNPRRLAEVQGTHQRLVALYDALPKKPDGTPAVAEVSYQDKTYPMATSHWFEYRAAGKEDHQRLFVETIGSLTGRMAKHLLTQRWTIVASATPVFATSDAPVVLSHPVKPRPGFATPGTRLCLPLSPTRFLIIEQPALPEGYYMSTPGFAEAMNYQTWTAADQYLISSRPSDNVLAGIVRFADAIEHAQREQGGASSAEQ